MAQVKKTVIVLALDPGITTGWAVLDPQGKILATGNAQPDDLGRILDEIIRLGHRNGHKVEVTVEEFPLQTAGKLAQDLREVVATVNRVLGTFEITPHHVLPGQWKTSAVGIAPVLEEINNPDLRLSNHERDAIKIGHYYLSRRPG